TRNTQEERQTEEFDFNRKAQELFKNRTFEDLARSDELQKLATEKGEKRAKFDLDTYLKTVEFETRAQKSVFEAQRLSDLIAEEQGQRGGMIQNYIQGIDNPAHLQPAYTHYVRYL